MKLVAALLLCVSTYSLDETLEDFRKHYGLSNYHNCKEYAKIFKCLTACKSIGFQVFRMDRKCKCTCHVMKTTTPVPFFMWRTNGTTRKLPETFSPQLYHVVGTLSPATESQESESSEEKKDNCTLPAWATTTTGGASNDSDASNTTDAVTETGAGNDTTSETTTGGGEDVSTSDGGETTTEEASTEAPAPP